MHGKVLLDAAFAVQGAGNVPQGAITLKFQTILLPVLGAPCCLAGSGTVNKELDSPFDMNLDVREQVGNQSNIRDHWKSRLRASKEGQFLSLVKVCEWVWVV